MADHATDSTDPESAEESGLVSDRMKLGAAVATLGVVVPGVADYALTTLGAPGLGRIVWALGYGTTVVVLFVLFIRPLDIGGD
ncbi:hypothetical protein ACFQPA_22030 [Halomarina halobia]|uniref:Uncharacterized protein n=1 Tax=Halomarina halobia TaxID=3033386 RepID=A0ABD6A8B5_9EURY|nr:hypothetical protein [Halomarina sp. PSR21]